MLPKLIIVIFGIAIIILGIYELINDDSYGISKKKIIFYLIFGAVFTLVGLMWLFGE